MTDVTGRGLSRRLRWRGVNDRDRSLSFQVVARSEDDALRELRRTKGITWGTHYRDDLGIVDLLLTARDFNVKPVSNAPLGARRLYQIDVTYRRRTNQDEPDEEAGTSGATYHWGRSEEQVEIETDIEGKPLTNSRGELPSPGTTVLRPSRTLEIRWYQPTYNMQEILQYDGVANSDDWRIRGRWSVVPGQVLSAGIDPVDEDDGRTLMVWMLLFRAGGELWTPIKQLDYTIQEGRRVLLDGDSNELGAGDPHTFERKVVLTQPFAVWGV